MKKFINDNVGQFHVPGNVSSLPWDMAKTTISVFISKRLAAFTGDDICRKCQSHMIFDHVCVTCNS